MLRSDVSVGGLNTGYTRLRSGSSTFDCIVNGKFIAVAELAMFSGPCICGRPDCSNGKQDGGRKRSWKLASLVFVNAEEGPAC